jgi:lipopolysaccharide transport system permease protein
LIALLLVVYKFAPAKTIILFPLMILPILLFTLGLGLIISILNSIVRDTGNLLSVIMMLGMYATPVLYAKPRTGLLVHISNYNPMYYFISAGRDLALTGNLSEPKGFIISCILAVFIFLTGLVIFHLTETRITERI